MKRLLFASLLPLFLLSCVTETESEKKRKFENACEFYEKSELRVFKSESETTSKSSGLFCVAVASYSSITETTKFIKFYAKNKKGYFCFFKCDVKRIQFKIDNSVKVPTVEFIMGMYPLDHHRTVKNIGGQLDSDDFDIKVLITCTDKQFPSELNFLQ